MPHTTFHNQKPGRFSRRQLFATGAAAAAAGVLGWAGCHAVADPADVETGSFPSKFRNGRNTGWAILRPQGASGPVRPVIHLHGLGGDHTEVFAFDFAGAAATAAAAGDRPFAVVGVDGGKMGEGTYFHPRATGEDAAQMVIQELIPLLGERGLDTSKVALHGISMGGFGALRIGALLGPERAAAICAASPALWLPGSATAPGAFDSAEDHERNSGFELRPALSRIPLRIDIGESDPFASATRSFISGLESKPEGGFSPGGHDGAFWGAHLPDELVWLGKHLAA
ncbi:putative esterase [Segniliparus rotundus DSM 44985]|uniref:Acyl-CoA:diacylglycerol acyltransferase n=1 Tax=Segniliparus rotundus (strain ATCC BAA-972 / CDC 1076 / CIP 108378 / DSM 44985 / JCM 13578) TaxID=640132 RepID=D6Z8H0_SEGRD|nr:alpha/beta hydrolase-fold protein [Segniliparus rotundus]ADG98250.1 putative esterase [Segniliparus rotundus DSM 44985]